MVCCAAANGFNENRIVKNGRREIDEIYVVDGRTIDFENLEL